MKKLICTFLICLLATNYSTSGLAMNNVRILYRSNAAASRSDWVKAETDILLLVNKENKLPDGYKPNLTSKGAKFDVILSDDFEEMRSAAQSKGVYLFIRAAYRSGAEQEKIYNELLYDYIGQGYSKDEAAEKANQTAALPGYSEHETGLAIDFSLKGNAEESSKIWEWLSENAYLYGFILRYPEGKEDITGYEYEPWHYRYVGKQHAKEIYEQGLVLEEYLYMLSNR